MGQLFFSMITFILAIFFVLIGVINIALPWVPSIRTQIVQFILEDSTTLFLFGFCFLAVGSAMIANIVLNMRRKYYKVRGGKHSVFVEEAIVHDYLQSYWQQIFPHIDINSRAELKKDGLHIRVDLPYFPKEEQKEWIEKIRQDLGNLFVRILGYRNEFHLSASFQSPPKATLQQDKKNSTDESIKK